MKKLLRHLKPHIFFMFVVLFFVFVQVFTDLSLPDYTSKIINEALPKGDTDAIMKYGAEMLGIAGIGVIATILASFFTSRIGCGFAKTLRNEVFEKVESFSSAEFDKFSTASLITRSTNDIQNLQMFVIIALRMVLMALLMAVLGLQKALQYGKDISWLLAIAIPAGLLLIVILVIVLMPKFLSVQKFIDKLNLVSREQLTGIRVIRAFNRQHTELERFDKANADLMNLQIFIQKTMAIMNPVLQLILNATTLGIIWFGAQQVLDNGMNPGNIVAFMSYAMQVMFSFLMLTMIFIFAPRAWVSAKRIAEVLDTDVSIENPQKAEKADTSKKGTVEFRNVSFSYDGADTPVLHDITFTAKAGETTAIIGSTGCGKSTLINLIPRFYDATEGEVLVSGVDVRKLNQHELREKIGYVPQKGVLFSGTIESNLRFGNEDADESDINTALDVAQASDFVSEKEDGIKSEIAQGGTNVSGGQKQRLSIARALMKNPDIFIFDDSFSALDFKTDAKLRSALKKHTSDAAVIIVAQRINTIMHAEQIIVLDEGKIVGKGTHAELLENCETYKEIALSQLSKEELA